jgi:hypothetical protein
VGRSSRTGGRVSRNADKSCASASTKLAESKNKQDKRTY